MGFNKLIVVMVIWYQCYDIWVRYHSNTHSRKTQKAEKKKNQEEQQQKKIKDALEGQK